MVNLMDADVAEKIIELERKIGWPADANGSEWEEELRAEIGSLRDKLERQLELVTVSGDGMIYGQDGWERFVPEPNGDIVLLSGFCHYMDVQFTKEPVSMQTTLMGMDEAIRVAREMGFIVR